MGEVSEQLRAAQDGAAIRNCASQAAGRAAESLRRARERWDSMIKIEESSSARMLRARELIGGAAQHVTEARRPTVEARRAVAAGHEHRLAAAVHRRAARGVILPPESQTDR